jgi:CRISPR-associated protein Csh2
MKKENRVYGLLAVGAYMANFNADLSGYPKTTADNHIFGSDKALKYPMKRMWELQGEPVLNIKSMKTAILSVKEEGKKEAEKGEKGKKGKKEVEKIQPRDLAERYEYLFGEGSLKEDTPSKEVLGKLFSAIDVMNFGATFAEKNHNISITGAVQINQGRNLFEDTHVLTQEILSPFRNSNEKSEEKLASSMGTKIVTDEAHYVYSFSVNPDNYKEFIELADGFEGYTSEAYEKFKFAARVATTAFNTNSKSGCENELALFIELKEGSQLFLANLDRYVTVRKQGDFVHYDLNKLAEVLKPHENEIKSIELYHNAAYVKVEYGSLPCEVQSIF